MGLPWICNLNPTHQLYNWVRNKIHYNYPEYKTSIKSFPQVHLVEEFTW